MAEESYEERTEPATTKKRQEVRDRGEVARSIELNSAGIFFIGVITLYLMSGTMMANLCGLVRDGFSAAGDFSSSSGDSPYVFFELVSRGITTVAPVLAILFLVALAVNFLQVGFKVTANPLQPKAEKFNPISGMKRIFFSPRTIVELFKGIVKLALVGYIVYSTLYSEKERLLILADQSAGEIFLVLWTIILRISLKAAVFLVILAVIDYAYQKWDFEKRIRMTKKEVQDELKHLEGNPKVRAKIRSLQIKLARSRMLSRVQEADVVITNPVHLAVALKYDPDKMEAPIVLAKGRRRLARKIVEIARAHRIPVMENIALARALYRTTEVGARIALELYKAVAEVLAFVYKLKGKRLNR